VDEVTHEYGHMVRRFPPYHCIFNPIELIGANVKGYVARNNMKQDKHTNVKKLFEEGCERITKEDWIKAIAHCKKEEERYWKLDHFNMKRPMPIVITVNTG